MGWFYRLNRWLVVLGEYAHNNQFKRDSARVAFLLCGDFGVEVQCGGLVIACFTP
ncbi:TPA: DUF3265 domain-containing protein [Vibrio parahaemolyticus]|nr:DUF3265 domain-containing protein [Vibrio parahaemolyticus]TOE59026.1 DUF3265 domain-containing protein [Vibrio parahaemolyticus]HCE3215898.1 DUF3265 domain-containing protein [Vibrio parahaemolyticus]HCE3689656.1 DUF3265 domain-containing protein [Vibrio parahaemolyticus]HCE4594985.1 DUF3265 domain-containing protein [Vibrio parahaemolyticus]